MKKGLILLMFCWPVFKTQAQNKLRENMHEVYASANEKNRLLFEQLHNHCDSLGLYQRADTVKKGALFVTATNKNGWFTLIEKYYAPSANYPTLVLINGEKDMGTTQHPDGHTVNFIASSHDFMQLKNRQTYAYAFRQDYGSGCIRFPKRVYRKNIRHSLQHSVQSNVYIQAGALKKLSLQTAPRHPHFVLGTYHGGF